TFSLIESQKVNANGEYLFNSALISIEEKIRIGAYVNDIVGNDNLSINNTANLTDEYAELGAYANDLTRDRMNALALIYNETISVDLVASNANIVNLYVKAPKLTTDDLGIGTYPRGPVVAQNYPNPFNPTTNIQFGIPQETFVTLKVYDMSGKMVAELVNEVKEQGYYTVKFDGTNLASGFYIYRLTAGDFTSIKKMSLIK
ncbi:unnamed protein product, partial [Rotaria sp. Silwood1]